MHVPIAFPGETWSNRCREVIAQQEPRALRTFTPSQAVLERSAGVFHVTPEGRRLYDYTSGVLVTNLGHNPVRWTRRFAAYMGWTPELLFPPPAAAEQTALEAGIPADAAPPLPVLPADVFREAAPLTAYNAATPLETSAVLRLLASLQRSPGGERMESVLWAASGSEAIQKALWACLKRDLDRDLIVATRHGFHGKKGLACAVTGSELDADRDPRVKFISFPREECDDLSRDPRAFDPAPYRRELDALHRQYGARLNVLITEPYLGGGGSYHPPRAYHQLLEDWRREHDILLVFDEVQSNFGRTGAMYAFETYGVTPDVVCLGKGLGNGVPVSAAVGCSDILGGLQYGEGSDTWSANPLGCAAVLATLDEFEQTDVLDNTRRLSELFRERLLRLKDTGLVEKVRGEGLVFGLHCAPHGGRTSRETAVHIVKTCYVGDESGRGVHLLGPLAGDVLRISPPMIMTREQALDSLELLEMLVRRAARG